MMSSTDRGSAIFLTALMILTVSCANRVVPQGGPVDKDPPVLLSSTPENMTVNFRADEVVFRFDEYVRLEKQDQIFISPPLNVSPRYRANGKEVIVELPEDLGPDITYTISFGNAIVDNNEGNAFQDFKYVFSTGPTLDSLKLTGRVFRAEDLQPEKEGIVVLYPDTLPDSSVFRTMPTYYSRLDQQGSFTIYNIREGEYRLFAIEDVNKNFLAEIPSERIAFMDSMLALPADEPVTLFSFRQQPQVTKVLNCKSISPGIAVVTFNGPAQNVKPDLINNELIHIEYNGYGDSLLVYHSMEHDSTGIIINVGAVTDTLWTFRRLNASISSAQFQVSGYERKGNDSLYISFSIPFTQGGSRDVFLDSARVTYRIDENEKGTGRGIIIPRPDSSASLYISSGVFVDIHDHINDSIGLRVSIPDERQTGILELELSPPGDGDLYVVVTDASWKPVEKTRITENMTLEITGLLPGKYILSSFLDENGDTEWTPGDFYRGRQPEKVIVNNDEIVVRANWTIQIKWEIEN